MHYVKQKNRTKIINFMKNVNAKNSKENLIWKHKAKQSSWWDCAWSFGGEALSRRKLAAVKHVWNDIKVSVSLYLGPFRKRLLISFYIPIEKLRLSPLNALVIRPLKDSKHALVWLLLDNFRSVVIMYLMCIWKLCKEMYSGKVFYVNCLSMGVL